MWNCVLDLDHGYAKMTDHIAFSADRHALLLLDQRFLPDREEYFVCRNTADTIYALQTMVVRGAPAIGVTAAYGCYLAARESLEAGTNWQERLRALLAELEQARPTAVNLRWAVERMVFAADTRLIVAPTDAAAVTIWVWEVVRLVRASWHPC